MPVRLAVLALNTYREAVRARVLLGVFAVALATSAYSVVVASLSLHNEARFVADLGSAALSLYGVLVAIVLGSTALHRELEYKTIFPILSRPVRRWEYIVGKYLGTLLTVSVFIAIDAGGVLILLSLESGQSPWRAGAGVLGAFVLLAGFLALARRVRVFVIVPWAAIFVAVGWLVAAPAIDERQLVVASAILATCEVAIVAAIATLFASFSSPFLTAAFTSMVFVIGRSADSLAHLPQKLLGTEITTTGRALARVLPNLHVYVPPRSLLLGQVPTVDVWSYVGTAALHAVFYATALLVVGALAFSKRDFA